MTDQCPSCGYDDCGEECSVCGFRPHKWPKDVTFCKTCGMYVVEVDGTWILEDTDDIDQDLIDKCPPGLADLPNGWKSTPDEIRAVWLGRFAHTPRTLEDDRC